MAEAAVETAILSTLAADAAVTRLLGGPNVFGRSASGHDFPYVTLGRTAVVDWTCGRDNAAEDVLTLHVWAGVGGKAATFEIMDRLCEALHDKVLPLADSGVVHLKLQFAEARPQPETPNYHGLLRFKAVRRPLA